ncbi:MAG TPA: acyl carrier protein [Solirubrobacteraceae bacterium]|jgi:acyl carrier protein
MSSVSEHLQTSDGLPALTRESVEQTIHDILVSQFDVEPGAISPSAKLTEALDLDSLALIEFRQILEGLYEIELSSDQASRIETIGDLSTIILELAPVVEGEALR